MKNFSEFETARFIPLSIISMAGAAAVTLLTGHRGLSLMVNGLHLFTLIASLFFINMVHGARESRTGSAVAICFFFVNAFYVFIAGAVYAMFRSDVTPGLVLYFLENAGILFTDTVEVLLSLPVGLYAVLAVMLFAGFAVLHGYADRLLQKFNSLKNFPALYIVLFAVMFSVINIYGFISEGSGETGNFRGVDFSVVARTKQRSVPGFMERYGYNIQPGTDIVFIILEGVSAEYFDTSTSRYLNSPGLAVRASNFFVPTPHTTMSIYSLLTGNYGDYRSRQKLSSSDSANSIPAMLREKGYGTYFLYSGPTYFEGLHEMLNGFGLTIINKEKLEKMTDPATGRPYRSFNWGVDDASLVLASAGILSRSSGPGLYVIGLSSTHSPYFNPDPARFSRFDNNTAEGRYRNSIDYEVMVIDMLIETFMRHNSDTLFVILSDHGESFGQEGYSKHSFSLYNTEIRVPFIMLHSSFARGIAPFSGSIIDVYPTLADMTGLSITSPADGRSFFMHGYVQKLFLSSWRDGESKGLVYGSRKWIYSRRAGTLYEMNPDDSERIDLTGDPGKGSFVRFLGRQY